MATIEDLVRSVPPPATPVDADGDWHAGETALGLRLPADYKALVRRYGGVSSTTSACTRRSARTPTRSGNTAAGTSVGTGRGRTHFKAVDRDWQLTYENACGHQIRVAYPPGQDDEARAVILAAAAAMGCQVREAGP